jgi:hypothetical protein
MHIMYEQPPPMKWNPKHHKLEHHLTTPKSETLKWNQPCGWVPQDHAHKPWLWFAPSQGMVWVASLKEAFKFWSIIIPRKNDQHRSYKWRHHIKTLTKRKPINSTLTIVIGLCYSEWQWRELTFSRGRLAAWSLKLEEDQYGVHLTKQQPR